MFIQDHDIKTYQKQKNEIDFILKQKTIQCQKFIKREKIFLFEGRTSFEK